MRSQRMHKVSINVQSLTLSLIHCWLKPSKELLDRYNPLHDLSTEQRVKATARRVGLDIPVEHQGGGKNS